MKAKNFNFALVLIVWNLCSYGQEFLGKDDAVYHALPIQEDQFEEARHGMVASFYPIYKPIPKEKLGVNNRKQFLQESFDEDVADRGHSGSYHIWLEDAAHQFMGYFSFDNCEIYIQTVDSPHEYQNFQSKSVYIRQLYVLPRFQRQGIARLMIDVIIPHFIPNLKHLYVATRRVNEPAKHLYEHLGFQETERVLHNLSPVKYMSFEKHLEEENTSKEFL